MIPCVWYDSVHKKTPWETSFACGECRAGFLLFILLCEQIQESFREFYHIATLPDPHMCVSIFSIFQFYQFFQFFQFFQVLNFPFYGDAMIPEFRSITKLL
jgi:hypothetical protein